MMKTTRPHRSGQTRALGPMLIIMVALGFLVVIFRLRSQSPVQPAVATPTPKNQINATTGIPPVSVYRLPPGREAAFSRDAKSIVVDDARDGSLHAIGTGDGSEVGGPRPTATPTPTPAPGSVRHFSEQFTIRKIAVSSDGALSAALVTSNIQKSNVGEPLVLVDNKTGKQKYSWTAPHPQDVGIRKYYILAFSEALAFSPDGSLVAGTTMSDTGYVEIYLWSTRNGQLMRTLKGPAKKVIREVFLDPQGTPVPTAQVMQGYMGSSREWADKPETTCLAFTPDGKTLLQAREDGDVALWDMQTGQSNLTIHGLSGKIASIAISADSKHFAVADRNMARLNLSQGTNSTGQKPPDLAVLDLATGKMLQTWHGSGPLAFSTDGKQLAGVGPEGANLTVWDAATGKQITMLRSDHGVFSMVSAATFSTDGKSVLASSQSGALYVWHLP